MPARSEACSTVIAERWGRATGTGRRRARGVAHPEPSLLLCPIRAIPSTSPGSAPGVANLVAADLGLTTLIEMVARPRALRVRSRPTYNVGHV
jgi:hypothetical protein